MAFSTPRAHDKCVAATSQENDGRVSQQAEIDHETAVSALYLQSDVTRTERMHQADLRDQRADLREQRADEGDQRAAARERCADERERLADEREQLADERDQHADERDHDADERERLADQREIDAEVMISFHLDPAGTNTGDTE